MTVILALRDRMHQEDDGFTLIELLVVIIIIGILAAIAIPVFLNQRQRGWRGAVQSDLRNAAIVMETRMTDEGTYACTPATATEPGTCPNFTTSDGVSVTIARADANRYCLQGSHANMGETWSYSSDRQPNLAQGACPA